MGLPTATWAWENNLDSMTMKQTSTLRGGDASPSFHQAASRFSSGFLLAAGLGLFWLSNQAALAITSLLLPQTMILLALGMMLGWLMMDRLSLRATGTNKLAILRRLPLPAGLLLLALGSLPTLFGIIIPLWTWMTLLMAGGCVAAFLRVEILSKQLQSPSFSWNFSGMALGMVVWNAALAASFSLYALWLALLTLAVLYGLFLSPDEREAHDSEPQDNATKTQALGAWLVFLWLSAGLAFLLGWRLSGVVAFNAEALIWLSGFAFFGLWLLFWLLQDVSPGWIVQALLALCWALSLTGLLFSDSLLPFLGTLGRQTHGPVALFPLVVGGLLLGLVWASLLLSMQIRLLSQNRGLTLPVIFLVLFATTVFAAVFMAKQAPWMLLLGTCLAPWYIRQAWVLARSPETRWKAAFLFLLWLSPVLLGAWTSNGGLLGESKFHWPGTRGLIQVNPTETGDTLSLERLERYQFNYSEDDDPRRLLGGLLATWTGGAPRRAIFLNTLEGRVVDGFRQALGTRGDLPIVVNPLASPLYPQDREIVPIALRLDSHPQTTSLHWGDAFNRLPAGVQADVIIQDAASLVRADAGLYLTKPWYDMLARSLYPHGLFVQLIPVSDLNRSALQGILRSFAEAFPKGEAHLIPQLDPNLTLALCSRPIAPLPKEATPSDATQARFQSNLRQAHDLGFIARLDDLALWETLLPGLTVSDAMTLAKNSLPLKLASARKALRRFGGDLSLTDDLTALAIKQNQTPEKRAFGHLLKSWQALRHGLFDGEMIGVAQALRLAPNWPMLERHLVEFTRNQERLGELDKVLIGLQALRDSKPENSDYAVWIATIQFKHGNNQQALAEAEAALALNSERVDAFVLKSAVYLRQKDYGRAVEAMMEAYAREPETVQRHITGLQLALEKANRDVELKTLKTQKTYLDRTLYGVSDQLNEEP